MKPPVMRSPEAARFLADSGLLFEINRRVLHPLGLSLAFGETSAGDVAEGYELCLIDERADLQGTVFSDESFAEGLAKLGRYREAEGRGDARYDARVAALGYVVQGVG
jgi:hypothetical protein